jgi:Tfp pilus assembly protein PilZ
MHPRLDSDERLFTQVVLSADEPDLVGTTLSCVAVNLSVGGIQFRTDTPLPMGALLDLWVDISSRPGKFFLAGEVRWTRPGPDEGGRPGWFVGVQLKSGAATDISTGASTTPRVHALRNVPTDCDTTTYAPRFPVTFPRNCLNES